MPAPPVTDPARAEESRRDVPKHRAAPWRLAVLVSHPIQYYSPWFRHLAGRLDLEVFYAHRQDAAGQAAAGFARPFDWDTPLLDGYRYRWLDNVARDPGVQTFRGCDTPELARLVDPARFDAMLVFGWNHKSSIQAVRACWQRKVPALMRGDSQLDTPRSAVKRAAKYLPYRFLLPRLAAHLYVGRRNREYLRHYGVPEERLFFAPHCVDAEHFRRGAEQARASGQARALRERWGAAPNAFVFAYVGRLIPEKRPADLVRALLACDDGAGDPALHVVVVGDGPLRGELERLAGPRRERVSFAGFCNQSEMPAVYAAADAVVIPGLHTWCLAVNEAAACGVPAVVSDAVGCAPDLIDERRTGFTHAVGDPLALADRMRRLVRLCREDANGVKEALRSKTSQYSIERATEGLEAALQAVARREGG